MFSEGEQRALTERLMTVVFRFALVVALSVPLSCVSGTITVLPADLDVRADGKPLKGAPLRLEGPSTICQKNSKTLDFYADGKKVGSRVYRLESSGAALILGVFTLFLSTSVYAYVYPDATYDMRAMAGAVRRKLPVGINLGQGATRLSISTGIFGEVRYFDTEPASEVVVRATGMDEKGSPVNYLGRSAVASCRLPGPLRDGDERLGGCSNMWMGRVHCVRVEEVRITYESGRERVLTRADYGDLPLDDCRVKLKL